MKRQGTDNHWAALVSQLTVAVVWLLCKAIVTLARLLAISAPAFSLRRTPLRQQALQGSVKGIHSNN
jgi:hypothetical protein